MMIDPENDQISPGFPDNENDKKGVEEPTGEDLKFNEEEGSFELDPEVGDTDYDHPLPYDTSAPSGEDNNSTYDEENPYTQDEYKDSRGELTDEGLYVEEGLKDETLQLDPVDEQLTEDIPDVDSEEDPSTDDEGYPRKEDAGGGDNPVF